MYLHYTPRLLHLWFDDLLWHMPRTGKTIYLTFDDGPIPEVTPAVLQILGEYNALATFFCVGENVHKHPHVLRQVVEQGHSIGNHTYHHMNGLWTDTTDYLKDVAACEQELGVYLPAAQKKLFRPPYGRFNERQRRQLRKDYKLVMWDVLSADFDPQLNREVCLRKSIGYTKPGSIIVFHDSIKAWDKLVWVLPRYLQYFKERDYTFAAL